MQHYFVRFEILLYLGNVPVIYGKYWPRDEDILCLTTTVRTSKLSQATGLSTQPRSTACICVFVALLCTSVARRLGSSSAFILTIIVIVEDVRVPNSH